VQPQRLAARAALQALPPAAAFARADCSAHRS